MNTLMQGVAVILINQNGEYLLHLRDDKTTNMPNEWCLIGGSLLPDELPEAAAAREVQEETGLDVTQLTFYKKFIHNKESEISIFVGQVHTDHQHMILGEGSELRFFTKDAYITLLSSLNYTNQYLETLKEYVTQ